MKLFRHGAIGREKPGLIDRSGKMRDLSKIIDDITPEAISRQGLEKLKAVDAESLPPVNGKPPVSFSAASSTINRW